MKCTTPDLKSPTPHAMAARHRPGRPCSRHMQRANLLPASLNGHSARAVSEERKAEEEAGGGAHLGEGGAVEGSGAARAASVDVGGGTGGHRRRGERSPARKAKATSAAGRRRSPGRRSKRRRLLQPPRSMDPNSAQNWNVPTGWRDFLMHDASLVGEFPDFAEAPMVAAPAVPPVAEGSTQVPKSTSKSSKGPPKPKQSNFSQSEDRVLVSCWINVSTDPITANGQRKNYFWSRIAQGYNTKKGSEHPTQTLHSLESRWDFIKEQVTKFASHYRQIQLEHWSGEAPCDEVAVAITRFNTLEKRPFAVAHCWVMLKDEAKWLDLQDNRSEGGQNVDDDLGLGLDDAGEGVPDGAESRDEGSRARKRPLGRDAAKEARKRAASTSESQGSKYVSKMSEMCLQRTELWKASDDNANKRLDKLIEIEARRLRMEEWKEEERIMSMDLSTLNPLHRTLIEKRRKDIATRWASED